MFEWRTCWALFLHFPLLAKEKHLNAADSHLGNKGKVSTRLIDLYFARVSIAQLLSVSAISESMAGVYLDIVNWARPGNSVTSVINRVPIMHL